MGCWWRRIWRERKIVLQDRIHLCLRGGEGFGLVDGDGIRLDHREMFPEPA